MALVAFAANSLLARAAIDPGSGGALIGAVAFTAVRLAAGALVLAPWWLRSLHTRARPGMRDWVGPVLLTAYALPFALAYVGLGAAVGALVLFGAVQATMLIAGAAAGERLGWRGVIGLGGAVGGVVLLLLPAAGAVEASSTDVPLGAALLMVAAGVAWGAYSLAGRGAGDPAAATARAFGWSLPFALGMAAWPGAWAGVRAEGIALAVLSGALTSGLGYLVWYRAVPHLTRTSAAVVQLLVPVVAALGAVALLGEAINLRLALAAALVLGGVGTVVLGQRPATGTARPRTGRSG